MAGYRMGPGYYSQFEWLDKSSQVINSNTHHFLKRHKKHEKYDTLNLKEIWWGHWEDAICEVSSQLIHWFLRRRCWRRTKGDHNKKRRKNPMTISRSFLWEMREKSTIKLPHLYLIMQSNMAKTIFFKPALTYLSNYLLDCLY